MLGTGLAWRFLQRTLPKDADWTQKLQQIRGKYHSLGTPEHVARRHSIECIQQHMLVDTAFSRPVCNATEAFRVDSVLGYVATLRAWSRMPREEDQQHSWPQHDWG